MAERPKIPDGLGACYICQPWDGRTWFAIAGLKVLRCEVCERGVLSTKASRKHMKRSAKKHRCTKIHVICDDCFMLMREHPLYVPMYDAGRGPEMDEERERIRGSMN